MLAWTEKQKQTGVEIQSGWLEVVARLSNPSDIAYVLGGLTLTAYRPSPDDPPAIDSIGSMRGADGFNATLDFEVRSASIKSPVSRSTGATARRLTRSRTLT